MAKCSIGTSGWNYPHWGKGTFYPKGLSSSHWLDYYSRFFQTVEVNNTFYQLPKRETFEKWRDGTPGNFSFALKASRFISHVKRLKEPAESLDLFYRAASGLGEKLGPVLFQLPPSWKLDLDRLATFLSALRRQHGWKAISVVLEVREKSWLCEEVYRLLEEHGVSLCLADFAELPIDGPITAPLVYIRRHGPAGLYASKYSDAFLRKEAERIKRWLREGKDVDIYFNNDAHGWAVENAIALKSMITATEMKL
ncbi:MAG: DUF72 domain-containing protein [Candidatus Binatia bacterium]